MDQEKLKQLALIYNALMTITTKGDDSFTMVDCLRALQNFIATEQNNIASAPAPEVEKED